MRLKNLLLGFFVFVVGLLMTIIPQKIFNLLIIITGLITLVDGIYTLIKTSKENFDENVKKPILIRSICCIAIGTIAAAFPIIFKGMIDTMCMIFGFILALTLVGYAAFGFFAAGKLINEDEKKKALTSESLISLLIAIILFILPIKNITTTITRIIGTIGIIAGALIIGYEIIMKFAHKKDAIEVVEIADADNPESDETKTNNNQ